MTKKILTRMEVAVRQIEAARTDTIHFLEDLDDVDWFVQPFEGANHVAWLVGHIALAQFGLTMGEVLGRKLSEMNWIDERFPKLFRRGSTPLADSSEYPPPGELRGTMDRIHTYVTGELLTYPEEKLDEPPVFGHPLAATKLDAIFLCARHESIHAGQIAMVRRSIGKAPIR